MSSYRVAPIFVIRMAGAVFEPLEKLATPEAAALARELRALKSKCAEAGADVETFFSSRERLLAPEAYNALRLAVRSHSPPLGTFGEQPAIFTNYALAASAVSLVADSLRGVLEREVQAARVALIESSRTYIADYLLFGAEGVRGLLTRQLENYPRDLSGLSARHNSARKVEQSLLLYFYRVAAKNDTFSRFGPSGWGQVARTTSGIVCAPVAGVAAREVFLERWTAHAMAGAMNADPDIFAELSPRMTPRGRLAQQTFLFVDTGEAASLTGRELEILQRADGNTPAHLLSANLHEISALVAKGVLQCAVEVPALDPHAFEVLRDDVAAWRAGPVRDKWRSILNPIAACREAFGKSENSEDRQQIMDEARSLLRSAGAAPKVGERFLYAAVNVLGEECLRICNFEIQEELLAQVPQEAALWIDFWRDSYAFVAGRVAAGLRKVFEQASAGEDSIPLPAFLRACDTAKLPLPGSGLVTLAAIAFQEVKAAFRERLRAHAWQDDYELTADDCHVVRNNFEYPKFDEYTYPSADLQIAAKSLDAIPRGEYRWIISELHPPAALLHHGFYWGCPDKEVLKGAFAQTTFGKPNFHFGFFAADFTSHTTVRLFDALPELSYFVAPQRGNPRWRTASPAETEVYVNSETGDVCLRRKGGGEILGSFARSWLIPLGFHPFQFGLAPHMPRLRCGNVIVQRESWTVFLEELAAGDFTGISTHLVLAIEKLRGEKNWPRYVYIRPTEQALRRSGAEGRDKDTKPVFIDLESYLSLEIFYRWLKKSGELEVTEMLPDPDHLCWQEADGRRTFELRTLIVPR